MSVRSLLRVEESGLDDAGVSLLLRVGNSLQVGSSDASIRHPAHYALHVKEDPGS